MKNRKKILNLSAIGLDSPGLVAKITARVLEKKGNIIDVDESCRHGLFSIFLSIDFSDSPESLETIADDLKAIEIDTGLKIILGAGDEPPPASGETENQMVTILGFDQPGIIARVSAFFRDHNINIENCRMIARGKFFAMEMAVDPATMTVDPSLSREEALEKMKGELQELCAAIQQSVVIQSENAFKKAKKIIVFDVESTLIPSQTIGTLLERVKEKVASVLPGADFDLSVEDKMQAFIEHVHLLKGLPVSELKSLGDTIRLNDNTVKLIRILKSMGFKIALLSSGFEFFLKKVFEGLQVDYAFSNSLKVDAAGILTGELEEPVLTSVTKNEILEFIMNVEKISRDQVVAVGDGSLRSRYIKGVGLSIAYKPEIDSVQTDGVLSGDQIVDMLYCLGIPKTEIDKYMEGQPDEP